MKKLLLMLLSIYGLNAVAQNWTEVYTASDVSLNAVVFTPDTNIAFAVGNNGVIVKSSNNGVSWITLSSGTTVDLNDVYFATSQVGWVVGDFGTVLKTTDGGATWSTKTFNSTGGSKDLHKVLFDGSQNGYAFGTNASSYYTTTDGGETWTENGFGLNFTSVAGTYISSTNTVVVAHNDGGIITKTGNASFQQRLSAVNFNRYFVDVQFPTPTVGYAAGDTFVNFTTRGIIYKTTDGGITWNRQSLVGRNNVFNTTAAIDFVSADIGFLVNENGIFQTNDGATTWNFTGLGNGNVIANGVDFTSAQNGLVCGRTSEIVGKIYRYTSGCGFTVPVVGTTNATSSQSNTGAVQLLISKGRFLKIVDTAKPTDTVIARDFVSDTLVIFGLTSGTKTWHVWEISGDDAGTRLTCTDTITFTIGADVTCALQVQFSGAQPTSQPCDNAEFTITNGTAPYYGIFKVVGSMLGEQYNTGSNEIILPNLCPATYMLTITDANGCGDTIEFTMPDTTTGLKTVKQNELALQIYPNPVRSHATIQLAQSTSGTIHLMGVDGKLVYSQIFTNTAEIILETEMLQAGVYCIAVLTPQAIGYSKLVKH
ncbi:MAG: YCF48-related protein [Bacteroidia bacterium]|jgi:photosystem II stability/assembly factor-like uncharacterized protein|nr:YCF48-related protein [Bacteroidia bacterium]